MDEIQDSTLSAENRSPACEHRNYAQRLEELLQSLSSTEEQIEEVKLKKLKAARQGHDFRPGTQAAASRLGS